MARNPDNYDPNNEIAPGGAVQGALTTRADPQAGAQVGRALQGAGQVIDKSTDDMFKVMMQDQGLANEHEATMAELKLAQDGGEIYNKYKNLEGLDASNSRESAIGDYMKLNEQIRSSISNDAARRAYDQLATRRVSYTVQDMNSYASAQKKSAYKAGQTAALNQAINDSSSYEAASNPKQFQDITGNAIFAINTQFTAPEYGDFQTVPAKTGKDGKLQFDTSTEQGKVAQHTYDNYLDTAMDKIWTNRINALANDPIRGDITKAVATLEQNKDQMSASTYAKLAHQTTTQFRQFQSRQTADAIIQANPGSADFYRVNYDNLINKAEAEAEKLHPGDVVFKDQTVARLEQKMGTSIRHQELQTRVLQDSIVKSLLPNDKHTEITSVEDLENGPMRDQWIQYQALDPIGASKLEQHLITANARGQALGYGHAFWKNYTDMAKGRVKNPVDFNVSNVKDSAFTNTGFKELFTRSQTWRDPAGHTEQQAEYNYLRELHKTYTGLGFVGGVTPESSSPLFDRVLKEVLPRIAAEKAEGKTYAQMFSKTINGKPNPDYIQPSIPAPDMMKLQRPNTAMFSGNGIYSENPTVEPTASPSKPKKKYASRQEVLKDAADMSQDEYLSILRENGWLSSSSNEPQVPKPQ